MIGQERHVFMDAVNLRNQVNLKT